MTIITRMKATQIAKLVAAGEDMAEIAAKYRIPVERVAGLAGVKVKKAAPVKPTVVKTEGEGKGEGKDGGKSAADDFK